jgi:hypothetical protein
MERLLITKTVLDKLGFSEYWDEHGDWGGRTLTFSNGEMFRIIETEENDDDTYGYASGGNYISHHYSFAGWFAIPPIEGHSDLFFLHEMHECITKYYPSCINEFTDKCIKLKMKLYLPSAVGF